MQRLQRAQRQVHIVLQFGLTGLQQIGRQFGDVENLSWVITAYLLSSTAVAPVFGSLADIYGRRVMIIVSLSLFVAGSAFDLVGTARVGLATYWHDRAGMAAPDGAPPPLAHETTLEPLRGWFEPSAR